MPSASWSGRWSSSRPTTRWPPAAARWAADGRSSRSSSARRTRTWRSASAARAWSAWIGASADVLDDAGTVEKFGVPPGLDPGLAGPRGRRRRRDSRRSRAGGRNRRRRCWRATGRSRPSPTTRRGGKWTFGGRRRSPHRCATDVPKPRSTGRSPPCERTCRSKRPWRTWSGAARGATSYRLFCGEIGDDEGLERVHRWRD